MTFVTASYRQHVIRNSVGDTATIAVSRKKRRLCYGIASMMLVIVLAQATQAQLSATATVALTATLPGHVTLSTRAMHVSTVLDREHPQSNYTAFPLTLDWNLNPREAQGFEVVAYFADPKAALVGGPEQAAIPAARVLGRWGEGSFAPFNQSYKTGTRGASVQLFRQPILPGSSRGNRSDLLELRIDPELVRQLASGEYQGVLYIEVRNY